MRAAPTFGILPSILASVMVRCAGPWVASRAAESSDGKSSLDRLPGVNPDGRCLATARRRRLAQDVAYRH